MYIGIDGYQAPYDKANNKFNYKWAVVTLDYSGDMKFYQFASLQAVWNKFKSEAKKILIDEPLGLDSKERLCDIEARKFLKVGGKVFRAPCYDVQLLWEANIDNGIVLPHKDQNLQGLQIRDTGHGLELGAYSIMRYIREARNLIISNSQNMGITNPSIIAESHPEVCFASFNNGIALPTSKKNQDGKYERIKIIQNVFPKFLDYASDSGNWSGGYAAMDDILDATILAITAKKIVNGKARTFPQTEIVDVDLTSIPIGMEFF